MVMNELRSEDKIYGEAIHGELPSNDENHSVKHDLGVSR